MICISPPPPQKQNPKYATEKPNNYDYYIANFKESKVRLGHGLGELSDNSLNFSGPRRFV